MVFGLVRGPHGIVLTIGIGLAALAAVVPARHAPIVLIGQGLLFLALSQILRARHAAAADPPARALADGAVAADGALAETEPTAVQ